jgi:hypothetical protein
MNRFQGHIDGIHNGELLGWAIDQSDPTIPIAVTFSVEGVPLQRTLACQHRADLAAVFGTSGLHGFRILLPERAPGEVVEIAVAYQDGEPLGKLATEWHRELSPKRRSGPCVLFMHIQKTAGTAFRRAILQNYRGSEIALIYPNPPGLPHGQIGLMPEEQRNSLRCVIGHFRVGFHENLGQPCEYVTILRDPIQRVISNYHHLREHGEQRTLETLLETNASQELDNFLTRCFCGRYGYHPTNPVDRESYEIARANLYRFSFIGHQEQSADAWAQLSRLYGWDKGALERVNIGTRSIELGARTHDMIAEFNQYDLMLYREIRDAWQPRTRRISE